MSPSTPLALALTLGVLAPLWACTSSTSESSQITLAGEDDTGGESEAYGDEARDAYTSALALFRDGNCLEAEGKFASIRRNFPYSRFAALAELRFADCKYEQSQHTEAISAYREFIRLRPSHAEVVYARFRIAESYFAQLPNDVFILPPSWERDQHAAQQALSQLRRFILDFPEDTRVAEARRMERHCLRLLAEHELYVADFYFSRDAYRATIARVQTLLTTYAGSGVEPRALLLMGRAFIATDEPARARLAFVELVERFPESEAAADAQGELSSLPAPTPAAD